MQSSVTRSIREQIARLEQRLQPLKVRTRLHLVPAKDGKPDTSRPVLVLESNNGGTLRPGQEMSWDEYRSR
jgi:hypothetical protein